MAKKSLEFGERLKNLIEKSGLNVNRLAKKINVTPITIWDYIKLGRIPEAPILYKLSKEFNISMEELLTGEGLQEKNSVEPVKNLIDFALKSDRRYKQAREYLETIFRSKHEDIKKAIFSNLEVFSGTVGERDPEHKKESTPGK